MRIFVLNAIKAPGAHIGVHKHSPALSNNLQQKHGKQKQAQQPKFYLKLNILSKL